MQKLTKEILRKEAKVFAGLESMHNEPELFGVTDGKAIGTYLEKKFREYLNVNYLFEQGNSASGIDFPDLNIDMKVTKYSQPQSSCPFKSARQKIFGLGYGLLIFVYKKFDDQTQNTGRLDIQHAIFIEKERTADYQTTRGVLEILSRDGNKDDLIGFFTDRNLPVEEIEAGNIADAILQHSPKQGYLTISNALQWRLTYTRVIKEAGAVDGILRVV